MVVVQPTKKGVQMSADFTPPLKPYSDINKFKFWCQKVLPIVYDDSLSYYEVLNKVVNYLNEVIENMDNVEDNVKSIYDAFVELQNYVNEYFDSQDWQSMVNNKIDQLVIEGYFEEIIEPLVTEDFNKLIIELNDFKEEVNGDIQSQNDEIDGFKEEINSDIQTQNDNIAVLVARMDTFASLPDGSTAGDAELLDIRVGANGITYPSAGDAVRSQVSDLRTALINGAKIIKIDITDVDTTKCYDTATTGVTPTETTSSNYYSQIISVKQNDIYYVTGKGASAYRLWALTDNQRVVIDNAPALYTVEDEIIIVSQNGYLYLNFNRSEPYSVYKEDSKFVQEIESLKELAPNYKDDITNTVFGICYNTATVGITPEQSTSSNYYSQIVPVKSGDVFYITGQVASASNYKLWAFTNSNLIITENCGDISTASDIKLVANISGYLYVNFHKNYTYNLKKLSIDGSIIGNGTIDENKIANLYSKSILSFGDSIAAGNGNTETGESVGYADLIASRYYMNLADYAVGGATITKYSGGNNYIETQVDTAIMEHTGDSFDFILIDGGTNDVNNAPVGSLIDGYDTSNCDNTTLMGSLEIIFNKLRTAFPLSNIIYVIVHKMTSRNLSKQIMYHDAIIQACEKWAIPYVDIFNGGQITSYIPSIATSCFPENESTETGYDSTHPNRTGYDKFYNPQIIAKMKSLIM